MIKVLLVEDEEIIRKTLMFTIDWLSLGCTVVAEAETGEEGLERIKEYAPDIVITDIRMADMNGLEMLDKGAKLRRFKSVILSGYSEFTYAQKAITLGASDYILKPIDEACFCLAIRRIAEQIVRERETRALEYGEGGAYDLVGDDIAPLVESSTNYYVQLVLKRIRERYHEKINIEQLAREFGVSGSYLSRLVKEETSMPFQTLLQRYRIHRAIGLMENGNRRIYQVAEAVGYPDYKRFCSLFKKLVGLSPTELLNRMEKSKIK